MHEMSAVDWHLYRSHAYIISNKPFLENQFIPTGWHNIFDVVLQKAELSLFKSQTATAESGLLSRLILEQSQPLSSAAPPSGVAPEQTTGGTQWDAPH